MTYSKLIDFRWLECRWFLEGFRMVISLTSTRWNSLQLGKPRFENPLYDSSKLHRTTSD